MARSRDSLAQGGGVRVVFEVDGFADELFEHARGGDVVEFEVVGELDHAGLLVDRAGRADADAPDLAHVDARALRRLTANAGYVGEYLLGAAGDVRRRVRLGEYPAVAVVHESGDDIRSAEILPFDSSLIIRGLFN